MSARDTAEASVEPESVDVTLLLKQVAGGERDAAAKPNPPGL
jgi:hypothetical protein